MHNISFSVRVPLVPGQKVRIVGSLAELGHWDPEGALEIVLRDELWESEGGIKVQTDQKFQFKIIRVNSLGEFDWQQLPNNANRKFKAKCTSQLILQWSKPEGKVINVSRSSFKLKGIPGVMLKPKKKVKKMQQFNPYDIAMKDDDELNEDDEDEQFEFIRRKMSDDIITSMQDLQDIYYNSSKVEISCNLLKKTKIFVISSSLQTSTFFKKIEAELNQLPAPYFARWINIEMLLQGHAKMKCHIKRKNSIFELNAYNVVLDSLFTKNALFILVQIEAALKINHKLSQMLSCLYLEAGQYDQLIQHLPELSHIKFICFNDNQQNNQFLQYLKKRKVCNDFQESEENQIQKIIPMDQPSIEALIDELQSFRYKKSMVLNTLSCINQNQAGDALREQNSILIIDGALVINQKLFFDKMLNNVGNHSLIVIIEAKQLTAQCHHYKNQKSISIIHDEYSALILQGKQYHPLRKFKQILQHIKMKAKLYVQAYQGQWVENEASIVYTLAKHEEGIAEKIYIECQMLLKNYSYFKVSNKGTSIKIAWNLSKQIRLIRTICEIKYFNYGLLGNINLLSYSNNLKQMKDEIKLLIQHKAKLFVKKAQTNVSYYSYGNKVSATYMITPTK